jgi:hypothetical protein
MAAVTMKGKKENNLCYDGNNDELLWNDERAAQFAASLRKKLEE